MFLFTVSSIVVFLQIAIFNLNCNKNLCLPLKTSSSFSFSHHFYPFCLGRNIEFPLRPFPWIFRLVLDAHSIVFPQDFVLIFLCPAHKTKTWIHIIIFIRANYRDNPKTVFVVLLWYHTYLVRQASSSFAALGSLTLSPNPFSTFSPLSGIKTSSSHLWGHSCSAILSCICFCLLLKASLLVCTETFVCMLLCLTVCMWVCTKEAISLP